ncbi:hypothetical protein M1146_04480, partial [Patescibacteria group bacterium]|nr:hypothetical protein [Patescibacteria group bacterium]
NNFCRSNRIEKVVTREELFITSKLSASMMHPDEVEKAIKETIGNTHFIHLISFTSFHSPHFILLYLTLLILLSNPIILSYSLFRQSSSWLFRFIFGTYPCSQYAIPKFGTYLNFYS